MGKIGRSICLLREFQQPIFDRNPHLKPPPPWLGEEESCLTEEQAEKISKLSRKELKEIDEGLLTFCSRDFQKVAKIVGTFMSSELNTFGCTDIFYGQRIEKMAKSGSLDYQGNLKFMRFSEVRILESSN